MLISNSVIDMIKCIQKCYYIFIFMVTALCDSVTLAINQHKKVIIYIMLQE